MRSLRHRLATAVWPRYSALVDQLNYNGRLNQWLAGVPDVPIFTDRLDYFSFVNREIVKNGPIDFLEFGVFEGESILQWAGLNSHPDSRFWGFDSFHGLPERWNSRVDAGQFNVNGQIPKIDDARVAFIKGWFNDTLGTFLQSFVPRAVVVVHIDADIYSSTLFCLSRLDNFLVPGSIILFDELYSALHEFRALLDWCRSYRRTVEPIARITDEHGRYAFLVR